MNHPEEWFYDVPPITRTFVTAAVLTSLAVQINLISPFQLYFNFNTAFSNQQYWRLITTFLYFGPLSLDLIFHLFFMARYSRMLEEGSFRNRTADYFWLLFLSATALICLSPLVTMPFLGSPLAFTLVYIWSRREPYIRLNFLGLFVFNAPFLPWVLLAFAMLLNPSSLPTGDLMGIAVGHVYYFFEDVWPEHRITEEVLVDASEAASTGAGANGSSTAGQDSQSQAQRLGGAEDIEPEADQQEQGADVTHSSTSPTSPTSPAPSAGRVRVTRTRPRTRWLKTPVLVKRLIEG